MVDRYKILSLLGEGATAQVYLVEELVTGRLYAMKCGNDEEVLEREAEILQSIQYVAFPQFKEYWLADRAYLVMEYIEGDTLQEILDKGKHFSIQEIVYIMEGILQALQYLHRQTPQLIYRDLKPANIIIDKGGKVRLIDMGTVCTCEESSYQEKCVQRAGTYGYAAPEQFWHGIIPDKACDIYATGKVLIYLLTGKNPAEPPYDMEHYCKGLKGVVNSFAEVIERSLAQEREARYEDCEAMRRAIHRAYEKTMTKNWFGIHKKREYIYKKCIWKSEYRRIF